MINENDISLIDRFISGELSAIEKLDFEARIQKDLEFAKAVRQQIHAIDDLKTLGAVEMGRNLAAEMSAWKVEGHKPYKSSYMAKKMWTKIIVTTLVVAGAAYGVFVFLTQENKEEHKNETEHIEKVMEEMPVPSESSSTVPQESLVKLKDSSTSDQPVDMSLNIEDPSTFEIEEISAVNGVYTYKLSYDGKEQVVKSGDPNLDDTLTARAKRAMQPE